MFIFVSGVKRGFHSFICEYTRDEYSYHSIAYEEPVFLALLSSISDRICLGLLLGSGFRSLSLSAYFYAWITVLVTVA